MRKTAPLADQVYTVQAPNDVVALDATSGRIFWTFSHTPAADARLCCGRVNRGVSILGDTLFMGTIDAHLIALDAKTGQVRWKTQVASSNERYAITHAPLIVRDSVIVGTAGGDFGVRAFIAAFDAKTGRERERRRLCAGSDDRRSPAGEAVREGHVDEWVR
jgi:alcohol dehydrogenase (cytochrome c)